MPACSTDRVCLPRLLGRQALEKSQRHHFFAERHADQICCISGPELPHHPGTMTFEGPRADLHPDGALLVGTSLADMTQNLALPRGQQRKTSGPRGTAFVDVAAAFRAAAPRPPADDIAAKRGGGFRI